MKELNPYILVAMDWKNKTQEELKNNYDAADVAALAIGGDWTPADDAACTAFSAAYAADAVDVCVKYKYWISEYFKGTGEDQADYEAALNKNLEVSEHCTACGEVFESCQCEGYAVVITDFLTDRIYTGISKGWTQKAVKCDDGKVWEDHVVTVDIDGLDMFFANATIKIKQEE